MYVFLVAHLLQNGGALWFIVVYKPSAAPSPPPCNPTHLSPLFAATSRLSPFIDRQDEREG